LPACLGAFFISLDDPILNGLAVRSHILVFWYQTITDFVKSFIPSFILRITAAQKGFIVLSDAMKTSI